MLVTCAPCKTRAHLKWRDRWEHCNTALCLCRCVSVCVFSGGRLYNLVVASLLHACGDTQEVAHFALLFLVFVLAASLSPAICLAAFPVLWCFSLPLARLSSPVSVFQLQKIHCPPAHPSVRTRRSPVERGGLPLRLAVASDARAALLVPPPCLRTVVSVIRPRFAGPFPSWMATTPPHRSTPSTNCSVSTLSPKLFRGPAHKSRMGVVTAIPCGCRTFTGRDLRPPVIPSHRALIVYQSELCKRNLG